MRCAVCKSRTHESPAFFFQVAVQGPLLPQTNVYPNGVNRKISALAAAPAPARAKPNADPAQASARQQHPQNQDPQPAPVHQHGSSTCKAKTPIQSHTIEKFKPPIAWCIPGGIETSHKTLRITRVGPPATELDFLRRLWPPMGRHHMPYIDCLGNTVHKVCIHM